MEYLLSRSMDVCRLNYEDMIKLHVREKNAGRCFFPQEIQGIFKLPLIKQHYEIPDHEAAQSAHNQRLRNEFLAAGLNLNMGYSEPESIHDFDNKVRGFHDEMKIDFKYRGGLVRRKISDEVS